MSGVGATASALPQGYENLLDNALHAALGRGQSVSVTATVGSATLAVNGTGAFLFDTSSIGSGPNAATFSASPDGIKDTITLSAAAQQSISNGQIALDLMSAVRTGGTHGTTAIPARTAASGTAQVAVIQATARQAVTQAAAQTGDNSDAVETALLAQVAAYQASPAAIANFKSLLAQGEQASAADRFYATYADPDNFQTLTTYMSDAQKASFTTAFNNQTLTVGGEADLGGMMTGSSTVTDTVQGGALSGTGEYLAAASDDPNTIVAYDGLFGNTRVNWGDPASPTT